MAARSTDLSFTIAEEMSLSDVSRSFALSGLFKDLESPRAEDGVVAQRQAMVKILAGREMGMEPVQAMMGLQIVEGRIGLSADAMAARIQAHPDYRYKVKAWTRQECVVEFWERFEGEWEVMGESSFTIWDGEAAGLCSVDGEGSAAVARRRSQQGKPLPWEAHTRNLLFARAMSNGFRLYTPHLKLAQIYTPDELVEIAERGPAGPAVSEDDDAQSDSTNDLNAALAERKEAKEAEADIVDAEVVEEDDGGEDPPPGSSSPPPSGDTPATGDDAEDPTQGAPSPETSASPAPEPSAASGAASDDPGPAEPHREGEDSGVNYYEWLKEAAVQKARIGEPTYYAILANYSQPGPSPKANRVPAENIAACLEELKAAGGLTPADPTTDGNTSDSGTEPEGDTGPSSPDQKADEPSPPGTTSDTPNLEKMTKEQLLAYISQKGGGMRDEDKRAMLAAAGISTSVARAGKASLLKLAQDLTAKTSGADLFGEE